MATTNSTTPATSSRASSSAFSSADAATSSVQASLSSSIAQSVSSQVESNIAASTTTVQPSSVNVVTSIVSASAEAPSTVLFTSVVTQSPTAGQSSLPPVTVVVTSHISAPTTAAATNGASSSASAGASSTSSAAAAGLSSNANATNNAYQNKGLSTAGTTAIAVVVPVVVVALLVLAGLFLWRRRKQKKQAEEARRKEVEEYGYNPNNDPTLPAVASDAPQMAEDGNGYRGWGATALANRKTSATVSGGHVPGNYSDGGSQPTAVGSDGYSGDGYNNHGTMDSDDLGALGAAPLASSNRNDMKRGPSNASSSYSAGHNSDHSDPSGGYGQAFSSDSYQAAHSYSFTQAGPYGDGSYGGGDGMPVVRDVSARRNTQIEQGGRYQQGNAGISQNF